jgi:hypothetical protein
MDQIMNNIVFLAVPLIIGFVLYTMFTKSGKGRMLGGTIIDSSSEEIIQKSGMLTTAIRAHVVESKTKGKHVGLEISEGAKLGASFKPIKLSKPEAETLIRMLSEAVSKT